MYVKQSTPQSCYAPQAGILEDTWNFLSGKKKEAITATTALTEEQRRTDTVAFEEPPPEVTCDPKASRFNKMSCSYIGIELRTIALLGVAAFLAHKIFLKKSK